MAQNIIVLLSELVDEELGLLVDCSVLERALLERNIVAIFDEASKLFSLFVRFGLLAKDAAVQQDIDYTLGALHADRFILRQVHLLEKVNLVEYIDELNEVEAVPNEFV